MLTGNTTAKIIGMDKRRSFFRDKYVIAYELQTPEGRTIRDSIYVDFDIYSRSRVGDRISVQVYAPGADTDKVTTSGLDAFLEETFGAFVHPSLR